MADYIFPQKMADIMNKISQRTLYEASMMAMTFIILGLIFFASYTIFFTELSLAYKIGIGVNAVAGMLLLGSSLATQYQQYRSFKEQMGLYTTKRNPDEEEYENLIKSQGGNKNGKEKES